MPDGFRNERALAAALAAKGIESPEEKLMRIVSEALDRYPTDSGRLNSHIKGAVGSNLILLWAFVQPQVNTLVGHWIERAREERRNKIGEDHPLVDTHNPNILSEAGAGSPSPGNSSVGGQLTHETQGRFATNGAGGVSSAPGQNIGDQRKSETHVLSVPTKAGVGSSGSSRPFMTAGQLRAMNGDAARDKVIRTICRLDTVMVNGKPVGDCTVAECWEFAKKREEDGRAAILDVRFVKSLCAQGIKSHEKIRDYWRDPSEVDQLYEKARKFAEATLPC